MDYIVSGYAYPTISQESLDWWLPRVSRICSFCYGFNGKGEITGIDDGRLVAAANAAKVKSMMVLAPMDSSGMFSDEAARMVFDNEEARHKLISGIEKTIKDKGFAGIDFDFEYLNGSYAEDYARFVGDVRNLIKPEGYITSVALAPKTSSFQKGILYEGHDYSAMGEAADYCLLMTYEWGFAFGPPMAVAPLNNVREVVEYALTEIPSEKVLLGMNNYGYDWKLPFEDGKTRAETLTNYQAEARAQYYGAEIKYDDKAQAPFYNYKDSTGAEHLVWFENERSWQSRLSLVKEYGLAGIGIWTIMSIFCGGI